MTFMFCSKHSLRLQAVLMSTHNIYYSKFDKDQTSILFAEGPAYLIPNIL